MKMCLSLYCSDQNVADLKQNLAGKYRNGKSTGRFKQYTLNVPLILTNNSKERTACCRTEKFNNGTKLTFHFKKRAW